MTTGESVQGFCDPRFSEVEQEFRRNFAERDEIGAAVSVCFEGRTVVDLWGGWADQEAGRLWDRDTIVTIFSCTKGLAATCMHILIDRGLLDVDAPVAAYWPEFAANGKEAITVAMVLSHQAGLPYWLEPVPPGALLTDWDLVVAMLAAQPPVWEPGTCHGYHGTTIGFLEGELVRRITGRTIGRFFQDEVAGPLGLDAWIGLPEAEEPRVAKLYLAAPDLNSEFFRRLTSDPDWGGRLLVTNTGGHSAADVINARARHAAEIPSGGGITNARSLARHYAPLSLDGALEGVRIVRPERLAGMRTVRSASERDLSLLLPTTFTLGYSKTWGRRALGPGGHVIIGEHAFGTPGQGGNMGFADGQAQMSFGYTMNRHGGGTCLNDRGQSLVDAAYRAVGFSNSDPGFWVR